VSTRVTVTFMTRYGVGFVVRFYVPASVVDPTDPAIINVVNAINAACASKGISIEISLAGSFVSTAGTGPTICEDKAVLVVPDDSGEVHIFKLPAPKLVGVGNIFEADGTTLNLADPNVSDLSASLASVGYGRSGDNLTPIRKGHRAGGKRLSY